jgi:hypothetical protein
VRPGKLGVGSAHKLGWLYARRRGYRRIVTLDADFSHDPADVPRLLAVLDEVETIESEGYSFFLVCAVRFVRAGLKVVEIPIHFHQRIEGVSKISQLEIARGALSLALLAVRQKWENHCTLPGDATRDCPVCNQPFLTRTPSGELRCLACLHREAAARGSALSFAD